MNNTTLVLGVIAAIAVGGAAIVLTREEDAEEAPPTMPPTRFPPATVPPLSTIPTFQWPPIPPSDFPIIGGQYVDSINKWCPPGYLYNGTTGMCEALQDITLNPNVIQTVNLTQGHSAGACCASCADGGPCTGCGA